MYMYIYTEYTMQLCASARVLHILCACVRKSDGVRLSRGINHVTGRARTRERTVRQAVEGVKLKKSMPPTVEAAAAAATVTVTALPVATLYARTRIRSAPPSAVPVYEVSDTKTLCIPHRFIPRRDQLICETRAVVKRRIVDNRTAVVLIGYYRATQI